MQKILIYSNEELFKALQQVVGILPKCLIAHITDINSKIPENTIIIGSQYGLQKLGNNINKQHLIGILEKQEEANLSCTIIRKPYRFMELVEMIRNILSAENDKSEIIKIGNFAFDHAARLLIKDKMEIQLTEKESALISLLNKAGGEVVGRDEILKEVWGYDPGVDTHTLETHIYRVRQKTGKENDFIGSSPAGYFIKVKPENSLI